MAPSDGAVADGAEGTKVGGIKARVAPTMLPRLYRAGRSARQELREWLRSKELEKAGIAQCFTAEQVFTREDVPGRGKPNPDMSVSRRGLGENVLCYLAAGQPASQPSQTMSGLSGVHGLMDHYSLTAHHFIFTLLHFTHFTSLIACPD